MKIGRLKTFNAESSSETVLEIDNSKIFGGITLTSLVTGSITLLTFWFITLPNNSEKIESIEKQQKFDILNFVLRNSNDSVRLNSLRLLVELDFFDGQSQSLNELIEADLIPDWSSYEKYISTFKTSNTNSIRRSQRDTTSNSGGATSSSNSAGKPETIVE
ncbi:MAG: hypothetical protein ABJN95_18325 [Maribacter sp.]|uniref:hypothetical protein n=1 Tax=Maribacter sp. TaxID=1897614 RepID=UPI00329A7D1A